MSFRVKAHLTAGVLLLVPLVVTAAVLRFLFLLLDGWSRPAARSLFGVDVPGLGIPLTLLAVYVVGLLSANLVGKKLLEVFGRLWRRRLARRHRGPSWDHAERRNPGLSRNRDKVTAPVREPNTGFGDPRAGGALSRTSPAGGTRKGVTGR